ncbi:hypothetical protein [Rhodococcus sp. NPDC055024]
MDVQYRSDLRDHVLSRVVQPPGAGDLIVGELRGHPPFLPRARAAAKPCRVFAAISSH